MLVLVVRARETAAGESNRTIKLHVFNLTKPNVDGKVFRILRSGIGCFRLVAVFWYETGGFNVKKLNLQQWRKKLQRN